MDFSGSTQASLAWQGVLLAVAAIPAVPALVNYAAARWAERRNPPEGSFLEVDGVRLHYSDGAPGDLLSWCTATR